MFRWLIYAIKGSITMSPSCWGGLFGSLLTWRCDWTSRCHHVPLGGSDFAVAIMATLQSHPFPHLKSDTPIDIIHSTPLTFPALIKFYPFTCMTSCPSCQFTLVTWVWGSWVSWPSSLVISSDMGHEVHIFQVHSSDCDRVDHWAASEWA